MGHAKLLQRGIHEGGKFFISVKRTLFNHFIQDGLAGKMNSLARSNASLYGNKEELYDRLRRHAYQGGKKGKKQILSHFLH